MFLSAGTQPPSHHSVLLPGFGLMHNSVICVAGKHLENFLCLPQEAGAEVAHSYSSMHGKLSVLQPPEETGPWPLSSRLVACLRVA